MPEQLPGLPGYTVERRDLWLGVSKPDGSLAGEVYLDFLTEPQSWYFSIPVPSGHGQAQDALLPLLTAALRAQASPLPEFTEADVREALLQTYLEGFAEGPQTVNAEKRRLWAQAAVDEAIEWLRAKREASDE